MGYRAGRVSDFLDRHPIPSEHYKFILRPSLHQQSATESRDPSDSATGSLTLYHTPIHCPSCQVPEILLEAKINVGLVFAASSTITLEK